MGHEALLVGDEVDGVVVVLAMFVMLVGGMYYLSCGVWKFISKVKFGMFENDNATTPGLVMER